jgi:hypothetical protein
MLCEQYNNRVRIIDVLYAAEGHLKLILSMLCEQYNNMVSIIDVLHSAEGN